jgi:predicted metal-dependent peptidase
MAEKLTTLQRIQKAHVQIMAHPDFCLYSGVLLLGKVIISPTLPTACTNGIDTKYGDDFMQTLSEKEVNFVVLHENMHKAYRHMHTWKHLWEIDASRANRACDYVINLQLRDMDPSGTFLTIWGRALIDEKYRGMNAKQVFDLLPPSDGEGEDSFDEHDWEGEDELTQEQIDDLDEQITDALRQGAIMVGKKGGNVDRSTKDFLEPKIRWQDQLRDFITSLADGKDSTTWARTNRRFIGQGIYMPGSITESIGPLVIGGDTSGSIVQELKQMLGETSSILQTVVPERVDMLWWDSHVAAHEVYLPQDYGSFADLTHPAGGGGTTPACVPRYMVANKLDPAAIIMMTDGCIGRDWGDFSMFKAPVLWVVIGNPYTNAPFGKTIHIDC